MVISPPISDYLVSSTRLTCDTTTVQCIGLERSLWKALSGTLSLERSLWNALFTRHTAHSSNMGVRTTDYRAVIQQ